MIRSSVFTKNGYRELGDREKRVTYSDKACQRNLVLKRNPCDMSVFRWVAGLVMRSGLPSIRMTCDRL